jgi:hypothetical protein
LTLRETSLGLQLVFVWEGKKLRMGWWVVVLLGCQSYLCWIYLQFFFSMESPWRVNTFLQSFHSRDFSPLRHRFCVVSFGFGCSQRSLTVSASCLIFVCYDCVVVSALLFRDEIRFAVGWRFFLSRFDLISECEWMLLGFGAAILVLLECRMSGGW